LTPSCTIYLNLPEVARIVLVALYSKNEQEDLAEDEKKMLRALAARLRQEAIQSRYRGKEVR
jgi:hypothetical protein